MKSTKQQQIGTVNNHHTNRASARQETPKIEPRAAASGAIRTSARDYENPVNYQHPYESMRRLADALALGFDCNRTRHAYYRQMRLIHEHFGCDPEGISEEQMREYFLFVKLKKQWQPKTIRQAAGAARMFFVKMLGRDDWTLFSQIRARDHDRLPPVLSREQVRGLITHIRLRRYRTPIRVKSCASRGSMPARMHREAVQQLLVEKPSSSFAL